MAANIDKRDHWEADTEKSVDQYNEWFFRFAPETYRATRLKVVKQIEEAFELTDNLKNINIGVLREYPGLLRILRMSTAPPIARDRLVGLSGASKSLVLTMEGDDDCPPMLPLRMGRQTLQENLGMIITTLTRLLDMDILPWVANSSMEIDERAIFRAATIIADRLCGAVSDPIVRNEQERRQLAVIKEWLLARSYTFVPSGSGMRPEILPAGAFAFRMIAAGRAPDGSKVNIPIDATVKPHGTTKEDLPIFIEAKSAGDFTNVNKRRKEEVNKLENLKRSYGNSLRFILFLCGYFDSSYLGYSAAEGIDWVWEHRVDDLALLGL